MPVEIDDAPNAERTSGPQDRHGRPSESYSVPVRVNAPGDTSVSVQSTTSSFKFFHFVSTTWPSAVVALTPRPAAS